MHKKQLFSALKQNKQSKKTTMNAVTPQVFIFLALLVALAVCQNQGNIGDIVTSCVKLTGDSKVSCLAKAWSMSRTAVSPKRWPNALQDFVIPPGMTFKQIQELLSRTPMIKKLEVKLKPKKRTTQIVEKLQDAAYNMLQSLYKRNSVPPRAGASVKPKTTVPRSESDEE